MFGTVLRACVHAQPETPAAAYCSANTELVIVSTDGTIDQRLKRTESGPATRSKRAIGRTAMRPNAAQASRTEIATQTSTRSRCGGLTKTKPRVSDASAKSTG